MKIEESILKKYPEQKPICFNYEEARKHILTLHFDNARLKQHVLNEASDFLQRSGFEDASKALDCYYEL